MNDIFDFDPLDHPAKIQVGPPTGSPRAILTTQAIVGNQLPFMLLIGKFHDLYWDLPNITTRDVDQRLQEMYDLLMDAAGHAGISRISVPRLRECCGKVRVWPDGKITGEEEKLGWGMGDIIRRITRLFGFGHCEACERRRKALNRIFRFGRGPSTRP